MSNALRRVFEYEMSNCTTRFAPATLQAAADARREHRDDQDGALFRWHLRQETARARRRQFEWYRDERWKRVVRGA